MNDAALKVSSIVKSRKNSTKRSADVRTYADFMHAMIILKACSEGDR